MAGKRGLTELEGSVLGVIRLKGPCTPYAIRCEFRDSTTPYWSASAGAIYPLVARLTKKRLLRIARTINNGRGGKLYALTAAGEKAFIRWLGPPFSAIVLGTPPDPIRTRVNFLSALTPVSRKSFLAEAANQIERYLALLVSAERKKAEIFERLALQGSRRAMSARLEWLRAMAETLATASNQV
jgi:DNA-binding PadR family transcriptional regulator